MDDQIQQEEMKLKLVKLGYEYRTQLEDMMSEWLAVEQDFSPYAIRRNDYRDFEYYLEHLETKAPVDGRIPDSVYFCLDEERNIFVGAVNIRHYLADCNCHGGGHIGDGVRPSERRKGVATTMIGLALEKCRELGINKVLMTCDPCNIGSAKSIMNNGGVFEYTVTEDGETEDRYWITLYEERIETERLIMTRRMPGDYKEAFAWGGDERLFGFLLGDPVCNPFELREKFERTDPNSREYICMIAREKHDGHAVGVVGAGLDKETGSWELSWIVRYDDQGKGYCTEMAEGLMQHLKKEYGASAFRVECADANTASRRVVEKLGFTPLKKTTYSKRNKSACFESTVYEVRR